MRSRFLRAWSVQVGGGPHDLGLGGNRGDEIIVPQRPYVLHHQQNRSYQFPPEYPITFPSRAGGVGISLTDATDENFYHLIGSDDPMFADFAGSAIALRLEVNSAFRVSGTNVADSTRFLVAGL